MNSSELRLLFETSQNKGCKFTSLAYRSESSGELSRYTLLLGADYKNAMESDLETLKEQSPKLSGIKLQACHELIESLQNRIKVYDSEKLSKEREEKDIYENIFQGVKQHKQTGEFYLYGMFVSKNVLVPSPLPKKVVNSKPLTVAKNELRDNLKSEKYRQFKLSNIASATLNGQTLVLE